MVLLIFSAAVLISVLFFESLTFVSCGNACTAGQNLLLIAPGLTNSSVIADSTIKKDVSWSRVHTRNAGNSRSSRLHEVALVAVSKSSTRVLVSSLAVRCVVPEPGFDLVLELFFTKSFQRPQSLSVALQVSQAEPSGRVTTTPFWFPQRDVSMMQWVTFRIPVQQHWKIENVQVQIRNTEPSQNGTSTSTAYVSLKLVPVPSMEDPLLDDRLEDPENKVQHKKESYVVTRELLAYPIPQVLMDVSEMITATHPVYTSSRLTILEQSLQKCLQRIGIRLDGAVVYLPDNLCGTSPPQDGSLLRQNDAPPQEIVESSPWSFGFRVPQKPVTLSVENKVDTPLSRDGTRIHLKAWIRSSTPTARVHVLVCLNLNRQQHPYTTAAVHCTQRRQDSHSAQGSSETHLHWFLIEIVVHDEHSVYSTQKMSVEWIDLNQQEGETIRIFPSSLRIISRMRRLVDKGVDVENKREPRAEWKAFLEQFRDVELHEILQQTAKKEEKQQECTNMKEPPSGRSESQPRSESTSSVVPGNQVACKEYLPIFAPGATIATHANASTHMLAFNKESGTTETEIVTSLKGLPSNRRLKKHQVIFPLVKLLAALGTVATISLVLIILIFYIRTVHASTQFGRLFLLDETRLHSNRNVRPTLEFCGDQPSHLRHQHEQQEGEHGTSMVPSKTRTVSWHALPLGQKLRDQRISEDSISVSSNEDLALHKCVYVCTP